MKILKKNECFHFFSVCKASSIQSFEPKIDPFHLKLFDSEELKWHRDEEDRIVEVCHDTNWFLQMDNELPKRILVGEQYEIPRGIYHRLIKGDGDLKVKIKTNYEP